MTSLGPLNLGTPSLRILQAIPLLFITYLASQTMGATISAIPMIPGGASTLDLGNGITVPLCNKYYGWTGLDNFLQIYAAFFTPLLSGMDHVGRMQAWAFGADLVGLQAVWYIEGIRKGNGGTIAHLS